MGVEVVGRLRACRPLVPFFPEHCHVAELAEAISGICEEVDFWVMLGVGIYRGCVGSVDWGLGVGF